MLYLLLRINRVMHFIFLYNRKSFIVISLCFLQLICNTAAGICGNQKNAQENMNSSTTQYEVQKQPKEQITEAPTVIPQLPANNEDLFFESSDSATNGYDSILFQYQREVRGKLPEYQLVKKETFSGVAVQTYSLVSQKWSPADCVVPPIWQHDVKIFIPNSAYQHNAVVLVDDIFGQREEANVSTTISPVTVSNLVTLAHSTNSIVIFINNIPKRDLLFKIDEKWCGAKDSDEHVAYSWALFLDNAKKFSLMPLQLPMTAAISQVMTLAEQELEQWNIHHFIVVGTSKRGWAAWLSSIVDERIVALVPFGVDILNTRRSLDHIYQSFGNNWPIAFYPYYKNDIDKAKDSPNFLKLMQLIDPLEYFNETYKDRFYISKYIVNASGDDFYVPDNTAFYYNTLPGNNALRIIPNCDHFGIANFTTQSLSTFVTRFQQAIPLPEVASTLIEEGHTQTLRITFSERPEIVILWTAVNPTCRDFRYAYGVQYAPELLTLPPGKKELSVSFENPTAGWKATFIEAIFKDGFIATTPVYISPKAYPQANGTLNQTLPGRK